MKFSLALPSSLGRFGNWSNHNGDGDENVTWKYNFVLFVPLRKFSRIESRHARIGMWETVYVLWLLSATVLIVMRFEDPGTPPCRVLVMVVAVSVTDDSFYGMTLLALSPNPTSGVPGDWPLAWTLLFALSGLVKLGLESLGHVSHSRLACNVGVFLGERML